MILRLAVVTACLVVTLPVHPEQSDGPGVLGVVSGMRMGDLEERLELERGERADARVARRLPEALPSVHHYELLFGRAGLTGVKGFTTRRAAGSELVFDDYASLRSWIQKRHGAPDEEKWGALPLAAWNESLPAHLDRIGLMVRPETDGYVVVASFLFAGHGATPRPPEPHGIDPDGFSGLDVGGAGQHHIPWGADRTTFYDAVHTAGSPECRAVGEQAITCTEVSIDGALTAQLTAYFDAPGRLVHLEELYAGSELYAEYEWATLFRGFVHSSLLESPTKDDGEDGWRWQVRDTSMLMRHARCRGAASKRRCGFELDYRPRTPAEAGL